MDPNLYKRYQNFVATIVSEDYLGGFKRNDDYRYILEHVNEKEGKEYLDYIIKTNKVTYDSIIDFCKKNDKFGDPIMYTYQLGGITFNCSPTSLRYILHTILILDHFKKFDTTNLHLVELGGGYGGLCLCLHYFAPMWNIQFKYTIFDLEHIIDLQEMYLDLHSIKINTSQPYGADFPSGGNTFLISNYCFAEIHPDDQKKYLEILFPKIKHGFITWNEFIDPYDIGFDCTIVDEYPQTGVKNKYIYF